MIVSRQNQKIKDIRRLRRCKGDRALLEGPHLLAAAVAAGIPLESVLATPRFLGDPVWQDLLEELPAPLTEVSPEILEWLADADSPRGVLAVGVLPRRGLGGIPVHSPAAYLYVDGLQDPGNLGALARVAEAFGVTALVLSPGSVHPNHPRCLRASAGSLLRVPVALGVRPQELYLQLADLGARWHVLVPRGGQPVADLPPPPGPSVWVVGGEGPGVSAGVLAVEHTAVTIPQAAAVESLNATVAAAIALYELRRSQSG